MLALQKEARRLLIKTSGRLESSLIDLAERVADEQGASEITPEHLRMAIHSLAGNNAALLQSLSGKEGAAHVGRLAG